MYMRSAGVVCRRLNERHIDPENGTKMKIWTCYPGLGAQTWYYTDDKRIALKDQGQASLFSSLSSGRLMLYDRDVFGLDGWKYGEV
jgi:hypothetical protein